jgi:hypothetical protein
VRLQVHPEFRRGADETGKPRRHLRRNRALTSSA